MIFKTDHEAYNKLPIDTYVNVGVMALNKNGISISEAKDIMGSIVQRIEAPVLTYYGRDKHGDPELKRTGVSDYLTSYTKGNSDQIMVGTLTTFSKKRISLYGDMTVNNINARNTVKKQAKLYEKQGDTIKYMVTNSVQNGLKTLNNLGSGAAASAGTVFRNRVGHNTLTVTTRTLTSLGNVYTDSLIGGNRYWKTINDAMTNLYHLCLKVDRNKITRAIDDYGLVWPSTDDVKDMIRHVLSRYRIYGIIEDYELEFVDQFDKYERAFMVYHNDLYQLKKLNKDFFVSFINAATKTDIVSGINYLEEISGAPEWLEMLTRMGRSERLVQDFRPYEEMEDDLIEDLGSYAYRSKKALEWFKPYMLAFILTDVMPVGANNVFNMLRDIIGLSDTDSTSGTQNILVKDVVNRNDRYSEYDIGPAAFLITILAESMQNYIDEIISVMNIPDKERTRLVYKNEFFFTYMLITAKTKHYVASTKIKEGFVYDKTKRDVKGVHLKSSTITAKYLGIGYALMDMITDTIESGKGFILEELLLLGKEVEDHVIENINNGDTDMFSRVMIKTPETYSQGKDNPKYKQYDMWKRVFAEKYPSSLELPLNARAINLDLDKTRKFKDFLNNIKDKDIRKKFKEYANDVGRDKMGVIYIPNDVLNKYGVMEELVEYLDIANILQGSIKSFYITLNSMGAKKTRGYGWIGAHTYVDFTKVRSRFNELNLGG